MDCARFAQGILRWSWPNCIGGSCGPGSWYEPYAWVDTGGSFGAWPGIGCGVCPALGGGCGLNLLGSLDDRSASCLYVQI